MRTRSASVVLFVLVLCASFVAMPSGTLPEARAFVDTANRVPFIGTAEVGCTWDNGCTYLGVPGYHGSDRKAIDFMLDEGTPVYAAGPGTVAYVKKDCGSNCGETGNYVAIKHDEGFYSRYLHLDTVESWVVAGKPVRLDKPIGTSGSTGTDAPHLHYDEVSTLSTATMVKYAPGPMAACHSSTEQQYPKLLTGSESSSWADVPAHSGRLVRNDGYDCNSSGTPRNTVDVALVIDSSGSMGWNDPSDLRKAGAKIFINAAVTGDYIGVVDFDLSAKVPGPLARMPGGKSALLGAVDTIDSSGGTDLGVGVQAGCDMLSNSQSGNPKALVLLTDGNGGYADQHNSSSCSSVRMYTVGLSSGVDEGLLRRIASATGGTYSYLDSATQLRSLFLRVRSAVSGGTVLLNVGHELNQGAYRSDTIIVPPHTQSASFLATWPGSTVDMTLTSPSGRSIGCDTVAWDVSCDKGPTHVLINVVSPEPGDWQVGIFGTELPSEGEEVSVTAIAIATEPTSNRPPTVAAGTALQAVQYSDGIVPVEFTASDPDGPANTLNVASSWSVDGGPSQPGLPDSLALVPGACDAASCTWMLTGSADVPAGTHAVTVQVADRDSAAASASTTIEVSAEDATVGFASDNPVAVPVATDGGQSPLFGLTAVVSETEPDLADGAAVAGDISMATVSMKLTPVGAGSPVDGTCTAGAVTGSGYDAELPVSCSFDSVPVNTYTVDVDVTGGYYSGSNEDVLVVYDPSLGFTTGGGWFYWPGTDDKTNFGYTMKYNKKGVKVHGSFLLIRHLQDGTKYRVKSNALYGLAVGSEPGMGWASFAGKSTYLEPGWPEPVGNHEFVVYVEDRPDGDAAWIEIHDKQGNVVDTLSMPRPADSNTALIGGGNIVVPH